MSGSQGAKAASKRERKAKDTKSTATSQLKANEAAKDIICLTCRQTFLKTTRAPALTEHASNKHNKTLQDCFPGFVDAPKK
ncbi:hypothetical protein AFUB_100770 [Aspergillus fumigatus A1163]|uniref:At2g23090-like zinc-binding domain-containing protein n=1 Tax=Aspergillus fumigatus (strain CBS 144.89 / FGSC A1163 / CEA10) TaxID=451804 RepID=B0YEW9_ASPFC|nr:hypothetical protein AFUB_100770 [Aspergillus fumigatus A1163]